MENAPLRLAGIAAAGLLLVASVAAAQDELPRPDPPFSGVIRSTLEGSRPQYPKPLRPPAGAPNVLIVLVDDAGFGNPATFGGSVRTPGAGPAPTPTMQPPGRGPATRPSSGASRWRRTSVARVTGWW